MIASNVYKSAAMKPCLAVAVTILLSRFALPASAANARKPNVLFLVADGLNCDLHRYCHPTTKP